VKYFYFLAFNKSTSYMIIHLHDHYFKFTNFTSYLILFYISSILFFILQDHIFHHGA